MALIDTVLDSGIDHIQGNTGIPDVDGAAIGICSIVGICQDHAVEREFHICRGQVEEVPLLVGINRHIRRTIAIDVAIDGHGLGDIADLGREGNGLAGEGFRKGDGVFAVQRAVLVQVGDRFPERGQTVVGIGDIQRGIDHQRGIFHRVDNGTGSLGGTAFASELVFREDICRQIVADKFDDCRADAVLSDRDHIGSGIRSGISKGHRCAAGVVQGHQIGVGHTIDRLRGDDRFAVDQREVLAQIRICDESATRSGSLRAGVLHTVEIQRCGISRAEGFRAADRCNHTVDQIQRRCLADSDLRCLIGIRDQFRIERGSEDLRMALGDVNGCGEGIIMGAAVVDEGGVGDHGIILKFQRRSIYTVPLGVHHGNAVHIKFCKTVNRTAVVSGKVPIKDRVGDRYGAAVRHERSTAGTCRIVREDGVRHNERAACGVDSTAVFQRSFGIIAVKEDVIHGQGGFAVVDKDRTAMTIHGVTVDQVQVLQVHGDFRIDPENTGRIVTVDRHIRLAVGVHIAVDRDIGGEFDLAFGGIQHNGRAVTEHGGIEGDRLRSAQRCRIRKGFPERGLFIRAVHNVIGKIDHQTLGFGVWNEVEGISTDLNDLRIFRFQSIKTIHRRIGIVHVLCRGIDRGICAQTVTGVCILRECRLFRAVKREPFAIIHIIISAADLTDQCAILRRNAVLLQRKDIAHHSVDRLGRGDRLAVRDHFKDRIKCLSCGIEFYTAGNSQVCKAIRHPTRAIHAIDERDFCVRVIGRKVIAAVSGKNGIQHIDRNCRGCTARIVISDCAITG